jgi:hypothetical protein
MTGFFTRFWVYAGAFQLNVNGVCFFCHGALPSKLSVPFSWQRPFRQGRW